MMTLTHIVYYSDTVRLLVYRDQHGNPYLGRQDIGTPAHANGFIYLIQITSRERAAIIDGIGLAHHLLYEADTRHGLWCRIKGRQAIEPALLFHHSIR